MKKFNQPFRQRLLRKWKVTSEGIEKLKKDLEVLGSIEIRFYKSVFSRWSLENEIVHSEPSDVHESNHVDILLDDKIIIQLLERYTILQGTLYEERIPENLQARTEHILHENGYNIGKKVDPRRTRRSCQVFIILAFVLAFLWLFKFLVLRVLIYFMYVDEIPRVFIKYFYPSPSFFDTVIGLMWLVCGIVWVYRYKKTSFRREEYQDRK